MKAVCAACLACGECAAFAIDEGITEGIWGGMSGRERRKLRVKAA